MNNFGIESFLNRFIELAPEPAPRIGFTKEKPDGAEVAPINPKFSAFVFKIQANMDPAHRDRVAFVRICSGHFTRNMQVKHSRLEKDIKLAMPVSFFGQERVVVEQAWPGDVIGLVDTSSSLRIGDTLSEIKTLEYKGVPSFSPEHFAQVILKDPLKRKQLQKGLEQLAEEGVVQIYRQYGLGDKDPILGAVGALQFEVLQHRLQAEYGVETQIDRLAYTHARWVAGEKLDPTLFDRREDSRSLLDRDNNPVLLFKSEWALKYATQNYKDVQFLLTAPTKKS
jgi:peptide chain release factor 3